MVAKSGEVSSESSFNVSQSRGRPPKRRSIPAIRSAAIALRTLGLDEAAR
jgi:hypothetical protein